MNDVGIGVKVANNRLQRVEKYKYLIKLRTVTSTCFKRNNEPSDGNKSRYFCRMDPLNSKATDGLSRLEKQGDGLLADDVDAEGMDSSDTEVCFVG
jgi:hypothetical protein